MKLASPRVWIPILSSAAILVMALSDLRREAPGELATVHGREESLEGKSNCSNCHGGWFESMADACISCHQDIGAEIAKSGKHKPGLHGLLDTKKARLCALCHSEHNGEDFALVNLQSFTAAGVPDPENFDHGMLGFAMAGKHLELDCGGCHVNSRLALLPKGGKRFAGLDKNCVNCHEDKHEGRMKIACASCHGQQDWSVLAASRHDRYLPLVGGHAGQSCRSCHAVGDPHSLEILGRGTKLPRRDCRSCHESPHSTNFIQAIAQSRSMSEGQSCVVCHVKQHESFREGGLELGTELHALSGFALTKPHDKLSCRDCHDATQAEFLLRYPGRQAGQCRSCHESPHGAQFDVSPLAKNGCIDCHDAEQFSPHAFSAAKHARTALPLTGKHAETACNACHKPLGKNMPRQFRGTRKNCEQCHKDAHEGRFATRAAELSKVAGGTCARCHGTNSFSQLPKDDFDHGHWTGFSLVGAHKETGCVSCHERSKTPDGRGRTFGRVSEIYGPWRSSLRHGGERCVTCHEDPHRAAFDKARFPKVHYRKRGCLRCHVQTSFRSFPKSFEHGRWTGFPLLDTHRSIDCSACHERLDEATAAGRTWGPAKGARCNDCHDDPHAAQFARQRQTDCRKCHRSAASFKTLSFDHDVHARFALGKAHGQLECSSCHKKQRIGKRDIMRYRPMARNCTDCHQSQDDPLRQRKGGKR